jgi:3-phosphoshikimate 1-carboxyvinyltransferase
MVVAGNNGQPLHGAVLHSHGDHRLAMAWGIAALVASTQTTIMEANAAQVSYPGFWERLATLAEHH